MVGLAGGWLMGRVCWVGSLQLACRQLLFDVVAPAKH